MEYQFDFARRRYGNTTYTWAYVMHNGQRLSLGDPWPCVRPKQSELEAAAKEAIDKAERGN